MMSAFDRVAEQAKRTARAKEALSAGRLHIELIMPDMAGESVLEEIDHQNTYRVV